MYKTSFRGSCRCWGNELGYYTDEKSVEIVYWKENNINVIYKKTLFGIPNTSDINIGMYILIILMSASILIYLTCKVWILRK